MNWKTFKEHLTQNPGLNLQFQYGENKWVEASYHITEIKQANIVSVDCGGKMNTWTEVILQLWLPEEKEAEKAMEVSKALKIIGLVEKSLPLHPEATVKIEFGKTDFDVRQMHPSEIRVSGNDLIINLQPDVTQCKAQDRGDDCGKPKQQLKELETSCAPNSGCCS